MELSLVPEVCVRVKRDRFIWQKRPIEISMSALSAAALMEMGKCQKRLSHMAKEPIEINTPALSAAALSLVPEVCTSAKRELFICQRVPFEVSIPALSAAALSDAWENPAW